MKLNESFSIIRKIVFISIILICMLIVGAKAAKSDMNYVTIVFPENYETIVMTNKVIVSEILSENHIIILPDEIVSPPIESVIDITKTITIAKVTDEKKIIAEEVESVTTEELLGKYVTITDKIVVEQVEIPYETITKDVSAEGTETKDTVLRQGKKGLKEIKYKVRYQDDIEIERVVISETIIKEPVEKIIQISTKISSRAGKRDGIKSPEAIAASVSGKTPTIKNLNTSAYCACMSCCGKTNGVTSSGAIAKEWYTIAAGKSYPIGTVIYVPALADKPNGGWFVVEDRGGAISDNKIDIYMGSHSQAIIFGRRNLECYIYQ